MPRISTRFRPQNFLPYGPGKRNIESLLPMHNGKDRSVKSMRHDQPWDEEAVTDSAMSEVGRGRRLSSVVVR
jgi:hypothetical protein